MYFSWYFFQEWQSHVGDHFYLSNKQKYFLALNWNIFSSDLHVTFEHCLMLPILQTVSLTVSNNRNTYFDILLRATIFIFLYVTQHMMKWVWVPLSRWFNCQTNASLQILFLSQHVFILSFTFSYRSVCMSVGCCLIWTIHIHFSLH